MHTDKVNKYEQFFKYDKNIDTWKILRHRRILDL